MWNEVVGLTWATSQGPISDLRAAEMRAWARAVLLGEGAVLAGGMLFAQVGARFTGFLVWEIPATWHVSLVFKDVWFSYGDVPKYFIQSSRDNLGKKPAELFLFGVSV